VVTAGLQRQIAGLFVAEERGRHALKGVPEPVTLFRIVRASGGGRRAGQRAPRWPEPRSRCRHDEQRRRRTTLGKAAQYIERRRVDASTNG
jgi:hypothetical protein